MDGPENRESTELETLTEQIAESIPEIIELSETSDGPLSLDPFSMGITERTIDEMTPSEKFAVVNGIYKGLGLSPLTIKEQQIATYETPLNQASQSDATSLPVRVYRTNANNVFLHEIVHPDGQKRFAIGFGQDKKL